MFPRSAAFAAILLSSQILLGDVVVVSNQTSNWVEYSLQSDLRIDDARLAPWDSRRHQTVGRIYLSLGNERRTLGKLTPKERLLPNAVYYLKDVADLGTQNESSEDSPLGLQVHREPLGGNELTLKANPDHPTTEPTKISIPVSIWVDDEQRAAKRIWEARLGSRFRSAASVLEEYSGVRFEVVRFGRWQSKNGVSQFSGSLYEFIDQVDPGRTLAIGFTSQYEKPNDDGVLRIAGTRKPLSRHILVREWRSVSEKERVELLVHELGHFLGASHSVDVGSAMRAKLGDPITRQFADRKIRFDSANTLLMALIGEELGHRKLADAFPVALRDLSPQTRRRLKQVYAQLTLQSPKDPVAAKYLSLLP